MSDGFCSYPVLDCKLSPLLATYEQHIEELEAKLVKAERRVYNNAIAEKISSSTDDLIDAHSLFDRIEDLVVANGKLEAKLAKVLGELKVFIDVSSYMQESASYNKRKHESSVTDTIWSQWSKQLKFSRATLAELSGVSCANLKGEKGE